MGCGASTRPDRAAQQPSLDGLDDLVTGRGLPSRGSSMNSQATRVPPVLDFSQLPPIWAHPKRSRLVLTQEVQALTSPSFSRHAGDPEMWKLNIAGL